MKIQKQKVQISVSLTTDVQLDMRELTFLRQMCQHCIETKMIGRDACERLNNLLREMNVADYDNRPTYGIFESKER
jgi:hypothetical protein